MKFSKVFFKSEHLSLGSLTYSLAVLGMDFYFLSKFKLNPRQTKTLNFSLKPTRCRVHELKSSLIKIR